MDVDISIPISVSDPQHESHLIHVLKTKFPLELLLRLTELMDTPSLLNLRLVCHDLERVTFSIFRKRFFTHRYVRYSAKSLRHLSEASLSSRLSPPTESIHFIPVPVLDDDYAAFDIGLDRDMLETAFSNLPSLRAITIRFDGAARRLFTFDVRMFRVIVAALSRTGTTLQALNLDQSGGTGGGLAISGLFIPEFLRPSFYPPLQGIKHLSLSLFPDHQPRDTLLTQFLAIFRNLEFLRLNLDRGNPHLSYRLMQSMFRPALPNLSTVKELQLGKMMISPESMVRIINAFAPSLTALELFRIGLYISRETAPVDDDDDAVPRYSELAGNPQWKYVFTQLSKNPHLAKLTRFKAGYLTEGASRRHVSFRAEASEEGKEPPSVAVCEHHGSNFSKFARDVRDNVIVPPPSPTGWQGFDEEDEDEDEDDDEDMDLLDGEDEDEDEDSEDGEDEGA